MVDAEPRRDYRGGGGYGGGRGSNKRKRFREDDDHDQQPYRNQRTQRQAPPGTRIRRGLTEIGEDAVRIPAETALHIARLTAETYDDAYVKNAFTETVLKLVVEQPLKIPYVAATVLFAHDERPEIAQDVVTGAAAALQEYLEKGLWRLTKLMLRFIACLSRLFEEDGIIPILNELFDRVVDLQTASSEDAVGLELVKIILLTIPYLVAGAEDQTIQPKVAELLEKTDVVASTPHQTEAVIDPFPGSAEGAEKPMECKSIIRLLQEQLQTEANNGWLLRVIPRCYDPATKPAGTNGATNGETDGNSSGKLVFPAVTVPSPVNVGPRTLFPEVYFSLFANQEVESVPPTTNLASVVIRDAIVDTVNILDFNRNSTARFLNEIDNFWPDNTFAKRGTSFDQLRAMEPGRPTWKPEDVAIDAVFSQIFVLPAPEHRLVYYHSIITEACKLSPQPVAPSLGRAIRFLYRGVDVMDLELGNRFMDWFAHHLSNFEFRWKWMEWVPEIALADLRPKKAFILGALDKEIRLSFAKRIRDTLPPDYHPLIPTSKEKDTPDLKFADDQTSFAQEGREVLALMKRKAPEEDLQRVLDTVHSQAESLAMDPLVATSDVYMTAILSVGSKSLSHVLSTIDRCKDRLLTIGLKSELARRQIISSVFDFWSDHPGTAVNIVDKLLNYTIVTPMSVIEWALVDNIDRGRALATAHIFEMIAITMFKVTNRVHQLLAHRNDPAVPFEQRQQIDEALPREQQGMRDLFAAIEDAVAGVAAGAQDEMIERFDDEGAEEETIKAWGARWARVWKRKAAVEEQVVAEGLAVELVEPAPPTIEAATGAEVDEDMDQIS